MLEELGKLFGVPALALAMATLIFERLRRLDEHVPRLWTHVEDHSSRIIRLEAKVETLQTRGKGDS